MLRLVDDKLAITVDEPPKYSPGGITIVNQSPPQTGTVAFAGPGRILMDGSQHPMWVEVGQKVAFSQYSGQDIEIEGNKFKVLSQSDILAFWN